MAQTRLVGLEPMLRRAGKRKTAELEAPNQTYLHGTSPSGGPRAVISPKRWVIDLPTFRFKLRT